MKTTADDDEKEEEEEAANKSTRHSHSHYSALEVKFPRNTRAAPSSKSPGISPIPGEKAGIFMTAWRFLPARGRSVLPAGMDIVSHLALARVPVQAGLF